MEFLTDIISPFRNFCKKMSIPFSEFFLENMTLIRGTPPCTPHIEVPPGSFLQSFKIK